MSLINDALRRAKQQTSQPAPVSSLQLRPLEPARESHSVSPRTFPLVFITVTIVAIALVITRCLNIGGPTATPHRPVPLSKPTPSAKAVASIVTEKTSAPIKVEAVPPAESHAEISLPQTSLPAMNVEPPAPRPLPLRLQAIFFNTDQPSALVSGKTVFAGSRLGEFQVAAISPETVMLINGSKTNLLRFNE